MKKRQATTIDQLEVNSYVLYKNPSTRVRITLEQVDQSDGTVLWAIRENDRLCFNRSTKCFNFEPLASRRGQQYLKSHRFPSLEAVLKAWDSYKRTSKFKLFELLTQSEELAHAN